MYRLIFVLIAIPVVLLLISGLIVWHFGETSYRKVTGKPLPPALQSKTVRFCDRLKNWVIEYDLD